MLAHAHVAVTPLPAQSPEALYAEYEMLMARVTRCYVKSDGRGKGRQGQILQQARNKYAEWQKAVAREAEVAKPKTITDYLFQATTCKKCQFPIAEKQPRSILGEDFYHRECDPSPWADY